MAVQWTKEQQQVISLRDRNILVSAAAGSGKTAVLVERILSMILQEENPIDVDKLLVVTFTRAAAGEMKERIQAAIEQKLAEDPDNEHLQRQGALIAHAQINTIDGFCSYVVRNYFHTISLDPAFRMMDEGEGKLMKADVVQKLLEDAYEKADPEFLRFVECYASGKSDEKLEDLILSLYEFSMSYPFPKDWLAGCRSVYEETDTQKIQDSAWMEKMWKYSESTLRAARETTEAAIEAASSPDGPYMYLPMLEDDLRILDELSAERDYDRACLLYRQIKFQRISAKKDSAVSDRKREQVKAMRDSVKELVKELKEQYYQYSLDEIREQLAACRVPVRQLTLLAEQFIDAFAAKKREKNLLDFADLEHFALEILVRKQEDGSLLRTEAAKELAAGFAEIMIDEYQDSNYVQEMLLTSVSGLEDGRYNIFMVGDVKQSIYRFRQARPELFLEKYASYSAQDSRTQRIDLHRNFRSRAQVLSGANYIFRQIMTPDLGGISYDDAAALYPGAEYPPETADTPTELLLLEKDTPALEDLKGQESIQEIEARAVAGRIRELVGKEKVFDRKTGEYRPAQYRDCVVLLRAASGWAESFVRVLGAQGVPAYSTSRTGYFSALEVQTVLNYLQICDNPRQDIPLAAVLHSPICGCTAEEMAQLRAEFPDGNLYAACVRYSREGKEQGTREKIADFLRLLGRMRGLVSHTPIHELLVMILKETGYGHFAAAMPGGEQRQANLDMLVEKAIEFEATSYRGLFNFIRYIEKLRRYEVDFGEVSVSGEQADTVRIMSIHKSKGLEFPVVIAAGMGKRFNQQDARSSVIVHASLGVGLDAVDLDEGTKSVSFFKRVMQREEILENLAEELRVLYVALTRAKEKLILTGTMKNPGEKLESLRAVKGGEEELSFGVLSSASSCLSWILPAIAGGGKEMPLQVWIKRLEDFVRAEEEEKTEKIFTKQALKDWNTQETYDKEMKDRLKEQFGYSYPWPDTFGRKLKFTVSELKKREYMKEVYGEEGTELGEMVYEEPEVIPLIPRFRMEEEELTGASRGSAYHRVLELLDFKEDYSLESMAMAVEEMKNSGKIRKDMAQSVRPKEILAFVSGADGRRMKEAAEKGKLWKEQPFVLGVDAEEIYPGSGEGETILVQGIIDVFFEEDGELVVLDYKTDKVRKPEELAEKYHAQLAYYAKALEQLTGKRVKEKIIYSFTLQERILL